MNETPRALPYYLGKLVKKNPMDDKGDISQCKIQHIRSLCWGKWHELPNCKNKAEYVAAHQAVEQPRAAAAEQARQWVQ